MKKILLLTILAAGMLAWGKAIPASRENDRANWNLGQSGMAAIAGDKLLIRDDSVEKGGHLSSFGQPVEPGAACRVRFQYRSTSPAASALGGVYLEFYDAGGKVLPGKNLFSIPGNSAGLVKEELTAVAPEEAVQARIVIRSFAKPTGEVEISEVDFDVRTREEVQTPAGQFRKLPVFRDNGKPNWNLGKNQLARLEGDKLIIDDDSSEQGAYLGSFALPAKPGQSYLLRFQLNSESATNRATLAGIAFEFYDSNQKLLAEKPTFAIPYATHGVKSAHLAAKAPAEAASMRIVIRSYAWPCGRIELSDLELGEITEAEYLLKRDQLPDFGQDFPPPSPEAVQALAAQLPDRPFQALPPLGDRSAWERLAAAFSRKDELIQWAAEHRLDPVQKVDREFLLDVYRRDNGPYEFRQFQQLRGDLLIRLALAEGLENRGRFLDKILELTESIADEPTWVLAHHDINGDNLAGRRISIDLGSSRQGALLITVKKLFGNTFPAELNEKINQRIEERLLAPYRNCLTTGRIAGGFNWFLALNNQGAVCSANLAYIAMAMELPKEDKALFLLGTKFCMGQYLSAVPADGYCDEGIGYWNYGFGHYLLFANALYNWTGGAMDEFKEPKAALLASFVDRFEMHGRHFPAFADAGMFNGVKPYNELATARFYHRASRRNPFWVNDFLPQTALGLQLLLDPATPALGSGTLPERDYFTDSQVLICRNTAEPKFTLAAKGGHNAEQHNHNDLGSYSLLFNRLMVVCDPGGEEYNKQTFTSNRYRSDLINSYGHPVPYPAATLQSPGRRFAAKVLTENFTSGLDEWKLDLRGGYLLEGLIGLERTFRFHRAERRAEIVDEFAFSQPLAFETAVVTCAEHRVIDERTIEIFDAENTVRLSAVSELPLELLAAPLTAKPMTAKIEPVRIAVRLKEPAEAGSITLRYEIVR